MDEANFIRLTIVGALATMGGLGGASALVCAWVDKRKSACDAKPSSPERLPQSPSNTSPSP